MIFTERYTDTIKTEDYFKNKYNNNYCIENNVIEELDIVVTGHFGNAVSLTMLCRSVCPIPLYNSTHNIGFILRTLIEIFDKEDDNSVSITELCNTPIRLVFDNKIPWRGRVVAIGNFMKDRFITIEDLMKL